MVRASLLTHITSPSSRLLGSLYTLNMAGKPILVVGGHKVAEDLFGTHITPP